MKIIPIERALKLARDISKEACLTQKEENIFDLILASVNPIEINNKMFLKVTDLKNFLLNFSDAVNEKDFSWLTQKRGLKVDKIVDIEEFVKGTNYLKHGRAVRPIVMKGLNEFWDKKNQYVEAVLSGSTSWGKNFFSRMSLAYMLYVLSCYHNPQLDFDLGLGSSIMLINQSKTEKLAKKVMFEQFAQMLKESPYFKNHFNYDPNIKSELRFPRNIYVLPAGGSDAAALGMDVYGGIIDELNFMERTANSIHTKFTGEDEYDQAERAYNALLRRIKGRFIQKGGMIPGKLLLISSVNYAGDFTDRKRKEIENEIKKTGKSFSFFMSCAQWDSIPKDRYEGKYFYVELGDISRRSRILKSKKDAVPEAEIIKVPMEYYNDFDRDLEGSLKDIAGRVVGTSSPFIPYPELILKAQNKYAALHNGKSLFYDQTIFLSSRDSIDQDWDKIINLDYIKNELTIKETVFACHIDLGLNKKNGDAAGFGIGRIYGYVTLPSYKYYSESEKDFVEVNDIQAPIYHIDGLLEIRAKLNDEIDFNLVRDLVLYLRGHLNLKWATMDTFQNIMMRQAFKRAKIRTGDLSVDTSVAPYTEVKLSIKDERIYIPPHDVANKELRELQKNERKIDHIPHGSKNVSDSIAGVVYILQHKEASYGGARKSRRVVEDKEKESIRKIRTLRSRRRIGTL